MKRSVKPPGIASDFEVDEPRVLGHGSLGKLCLGRRLSDQRRVALRLLAEGLGDDPGFVARFTRAMEAVSGLRGHAIIPVLGSGRLENGLFFASELVEGDDLSKHLARGARFTTDEILHLAKGIGEALRESRKHGLIHGRLRPSSVFFASDGKVRVADLGLSEILPATPTSPWLGGGGRYLAPEQAGGGAPDARTDVYALGTLLYELATGRPPFEGHASPTSLQFQLMHENPRPPRESGSTVPRELERLILRCLAKEPENRCSGPEELLEDLEEIRGGLRAVNPSTAPEENDTGDFEIDEEQMLGQGGMGTLYRGRQRSLGRAVAVKVIRPLLLLEADLVARFRREAELLAQLNDPNIVQVFGTGTWKGRFFYAMELVEGKDLSAALKEKGRLSETEILHVAEGVGKALRAAWNFRIVHRDIKPSNVLITREGVIKVADFGMAKSLRVEGPESTCVMGTLAYLSPEQALGDAVDTRSDIYSLGVLLYELAVGEPPFVPGPATRVIYQHVHSAPPLFEPAARISDGLKKLILRCLSKALGDRYQSPDHFLADLGLLREAPKAPVGPSKRPPKTANNSWKQAYAFHMSLGDYANAIRIAELHGRPKGREYRRAWDLHRAATLRDLEKEAFDRLLAADWAAAADRYRELLEARSADDVDRVPALECCRDLARAKDLEGLGEWDKAAAIYRRYVDLDPGPKGHVRERLLDVMRRSGAPPT